MELADLFEDGTLSPILLADAQCHSVPLPGFEGVTINRSTREGKLDLVHAYFDQIDDGDFA